MPAGKTYIPTVVTGTTLRYDSTDINECRTFLRVQGLECEPGTAWRSDTMRGAIYFDDKSGGGPWHAACWPRWEITDGSASWPRKETT